MHLVFLKWIYLWLLIATLELSKGDETEDQRGSGYDCENEFFSDPVVEYYAGKGLAIHGTNSEYPKPFRGSLYDNRLEYYIWPLFHFKNEPNALVRPYFVVFNLYREVIDVVIQMGNQKFVKCIRVSKTSKITAQHASQPLNGHQCPEKFFHDKFVIKSARMGQQIHASKSKGSNICKSSLFKGAIRLVCPLKEELVEKYELSDRNVELMLLSLGNENSALPGGLSSVYNVMINTDGTVADVVVVLLDGEFMSCPRGRGSPNTANVKNSVSRINTGYGFQCKRNFFTDAHIKNVQKFVRSGCESSKKSLSYPKEYRNLRNRAEYCTWPLLPGGEIYIPKSHQRKFVYFAIMNRHYKVLRVFEVGIRGLEIDCPRMLNRETRYDDIGIGD